MKENPRLAVRAPGAPLALVLALLGACGWLGGRAVAAPAQSQAPRTDTVLILHTNDIHDIIKEPRGETLGGIAYISGYVHQVRAQRKDVLALDAGDALQKGDTLAVVTKGETTYRALGAVGYNASVPGNHDFAYGMDQLMINRKAAGFPIICAGLNYADTGEPVLAQTLELDVDGVRVGIIGGTTGVGEPVYQGRKIQKLPLPELGQRIHDLAAEMEPRVQLTVVILHNGLKACAQIAERAPEVDVVVGGHTNELTEQPQQAQTGALIVEVGRAGQWVGRLDLTVDVEAKKVLHSDYQLVPMDHKTIQPDEALAQQIHAWGMQYCPQAEEVIAQAPQGLPGAGKEGGIGQQGRWLAEALRHAAKADVVLFHRDMFRGGLLPGPVTADDLYKMIQPRYCKPVCVFTVSGRQLPAILEHGVGGRGDYAIGVGLQADSSKPAGQRIVESDIDPDRSYCVAVPQTYIVAPANKPAGIDSLLKEMNVPVTEMKETVLDAAVAYARQSKTIAPPAGGG